MLLSAGIKFYHQKFIGAFLPQVLSPPGAPNDPF